MPSFLHRCSSRPPAPVAGRVGFDPRLQFYSFQTGQAKPGRHLFDLAAKALLARGVHSRNVLYIGNDMLNDVAAACRAGFRTAWFAGDARSLHRRAEDPRVAGTQSDLIVTHMCQLPECI